MRMKFFPASFLASGIVWPAIAGASFCTLNTQWETQGITTQPGLRADLRFEYIKQDQSRGGRDAVQTGGIHRHHDEVSTKRWS